MLIPTVTVPAVTVSVVTVLVLLPLLLIYSKNCSKNFQDSVLQLTTNN